MSNIFDINRLLADNGSLIFGLSGASMDLAQIGLELRNRRLVLGFSQDALAKAAGVSRATVNGLERGTLNDLGFSKVHALLAVVGCDISAGARNSAKAFSAPARQYRGSGQNDWKNHPSMAHWARKYIWWQTPEESLENPLRIVAQLMDLGDWDDVRSLQNIAGSQPMREALQKALPGWFRPRSWAFWVAVFRCQSDSSKTPVVRPKRNFDALPDPVQHSS